MTRYAPTWASIDRHVAAPEWFQDAKIGIYHHWGAFSAPAFHDEYPRDMHRTRVATGIRAHESDPDEAHASSFTTGRPSRSVAPYLQERLTAHKISGTSWIPAADF